MKSFFELRESAKQLSEKTMELAGVTLQNMEHCPGAVSAFKQNLKDGASEADVAKAAKAVDAYLAIEDKAKKSGATEDDLEEMEDLVDKAKEIIDELGLEGHTYHDMHLERVEDMIDGEYKDDDDEDMNEAVEDDMPASPDEKSMALDQAKFLQYVGKEITQYLEKNKEFPEWMQNKLSGLHQKAKDMHAVLAGDYEDGDMNEAYTSFKTGEEKSAFEAGKKAFRSGKKYTDNPYKDANQKLAWSKGHNQAKARKLGVREDTELDEAMTASQHRMAMLDKIKKSGVVKQGSMSKNETVDEVLDTPQAMQSYRNKAKASKEKAAKSATAAVLRSKDKDSRAHPAKDLKTIAKRTAGERMADKAAMRKTFNRLRGKK